MNNSLIQITSHCSVYENNSYSRVGYGSGNLGADLCYVEYFHTNSIEAIKIVTRGC